ncbi:MAG: response regulator [Pseudomonadota bacterium]
MIHVHNDSFGSLQKGLKLLTSGKADDFIPLWWVREVTMAETGILVVDDDSVIRISIERAARKQGMPRQVAFAKNGEEALEYLERSAAAGEGRSWLVLLDINMPVMDGFGVLEAIAKRPGLARVPVFILSSSDAPNDIDMAYDRGAAGYILKGTSMAEVNETLEFVETYLRNVRVLPPIPSPGVADR